MTEFGGSPSASRSSASRCSSCTWRHWAAAFAIAWTLRNAARLAAAPPPPARVGRPGLSRNYLFSGFPWANLGYTQVRTLRIAQLAALAGVYAIAALVVLVNAVLAEAIAARVERRPVPRTALVATAPGLLPVVVHGSCGSVTCARDGRGAEAHRRDRAAEREPVREEQVARQSRVHPRAARAPHRRGGPARRGSRRLARVLVPVYLSPGVRSLRCPATGCRSSRAHLLMGRRRSSVLDARWTDGERGSAT